jgi:hypothetical protein
MCGGSSGGRRGAAAAVALGAILAGCGALQTPQRDFSSVFRTAIPQQPDANTSAQPEFECPGIVIRSGAATYSISADPKEPSALNLRYQIGIGDTARECRLAAGTVTMKVGIQGRVVLGPAGGPGTLEVPLRFAVVQEGTEPKTIVTKLERVAVIIQQNDPHVLFTHIEEGISFPMPRGGLIDSYVLYVGFDPLGAQPKRLPPAAAKKRHPA